jgi:hypothetical protein
MVGMAHGEAKAKRLRITLSDIGITITGLCLSLSLGMAFVRVHDQSMALITAFTAAFLFGGSGGFMIARFLGKPVRVVLRVTLFSGICLTLVILLAVADYGPFP